MGLCSGVVSLTGGVSLAGPRSGDENLTCWVGLGIRGAGPVVTGGGSLVTRGDESSSDRRHQGAFFGASTSLMMRSDWLNSGCERFLAWAWDSEQP